MPLHIPQAILAHVEGHPFTSDSIGQSGAQVLLFPDSVLKIRPAGNLPQRERAVLQWLDGRLPAPRIIASAQQDQMDYLLMTRLTGQMLCAEEYLDHPQRLCQLLGEGMRLLHHMDASSCPVDRSLGVILKEAEERICHGRCDDVHESGFATPEALLRHLIDNKPEEHLVFTHGDYCLPNILANEDGVCGLIDLGDAGLADPYIDIALGYQSLVRNLTGFFGGAVRPLPDKHLLMDWLGVTPDWEKLEYYLLLEYLF